MSSLDFRKPRADTPIVPQTALFRKRVISQKRPKGRRGRKIKGKRVGSSVSYQDPNFILIKAADEARKERELKVRAGERAEQELRQAGERLDIQRQEAADARVRIWLSGLWRQPKLIQLEQHNKFSSQSLQR